MTSSKLAPLGALAAGFGLAGLSFAQTPPAAPEAAASAPAADVTLRPVVVRGQGAVQDKDTVRATSTTIGKGKQDIRDIPQSITVITEKLLDDAKLTSLKEALHYSAGITFAATENGTDQDIRMRGFPVASTGDLMLDGMRDPSQYDRDTFNLDRIEVMRGSASMLFGRGSTGGVVNQVSKKPLLMDQSDYIGTIGSDGYLRGTVDFNKRLGEHSALRINAMGTKADNDGAKIEKHGIAPTFSWGLDTSDEFTVGLFHLKNSGRPLSSVRWVSGTIADIEPGNWYGTTADTLKGEASYVHGSWLHRFADNSELRTQLRSGVFERTQWSTAAGACSTAALNANGGCPNTAPAVTADQFNDDTLLARSGLTPRKDRYKATYLQSDYSKTIDAFGMRHNLLGGFDAAHESARRFQNNGFANPLGTRPPTTVGNPDDGAGLIGTGNAPSFRQSSEYSANAWGVYLQDLVQVAPAWKLLAGLRYDQFRGSFQQSPINAQTGVVTESSASIDESPWSSRFGVLYQPTPTMSFHASYGTSFNTSADTYQYVSPQTANTPPEKSRNYEIGAKLDWLDNRLSTRFAIFRTEKYNERTTDADFADSAFLLSGKRHSQGIEADVTGRINEAWEVYLSASFIPQAKIDAIGSAQSTVVGSRVGLTPKWSGSTWIGYKPNEQMRFGLGLRGQTENNPLQGTSGAASPNRAPGYVAYDALAEYHFTPDLFAQLNVINLTNKLYGDQLYPGFVVYGAPRTYQLTVGLRY